MDDNKPPESEDSDLVDALISRAYCRLSLLRAMRSTERSSVHEARSAENAQLEALLRRPSPDDPIVAGALLRYWSEASRKPVSHGNVRGVGLTCTVFYLQWVVETVGSKALEALAARERDAASRFVEVFVAHANERIHHYQMAFWVGIGAQMGEAIATHWRTVKRRVLGGSLVIDGHRIERPAYRLRWPHAQRVRSGK